MNTTQSQPIKSQYYTTLTGIDVILVLLGLQLPLFAIKFDFFSPNSNNPIGIQVRSFDITNTPIGPRKGGILMPGQRLMVNVNATRNAIKFTEGCKNIFQHTLFLQDNVPQPILIKIIEGGKLEIFNQTFQAVPGIKSP